MGTEERQSKADLSPPLHEEGLSDELVEFHREVRESAIQYSFFRLVYLLERAYAKSPSVGHLGPAREERIRFKGDTSLIFHSSDLYEAVRKKSSDDVVRTWIGTTFLALYGSKSPLPTFFAEELAQAEAQNDHEPIREFFDVFHHRILSFVYRCWTKYRLAVSYRTRGQDAFTKRIFCAVGVDAYQEYPTAVDRFYYLRYAPLLAWKSRSAEGLRIVLEDLFGELGVKIDQFIGQWVLIEKPHRNKIGVKNHQLGESLTIGKWVFDGSSRYTIVLGPLSYDDYLSLLPGGWRRPILRGVCATFTRGIYDVMLELHVKTDAAPKFQLGSPRASTLKRTAWLGGSGGTNFQLTVPLEEPTERVLLPDEEDEDPGEPPPLDM